MAKRFGELGRHDAAIAVRHHSDAADAAVDRRNQLLPHGANVLLGRAVPLDRHILAVDQALIVVGVGDQHVVAERDGPLDVRHLGAHVQRMVDDETARPLAGPNDAAAVHQNQQLLGAVECATRAKHKRRFVAARTGRHIDAVQANLLQHGVYVLGDHVADGLVAGLVEVAIGAGTEVERRVGGLAALVEQP